jgi:hypothetical protein
MSLQSLRLALATCAPLFVLGNRPGSQRLAA